MIQLTQDETNAINLLGAQAQQAQTQLQQIQAAQLSVIKLLEDKYNAVLNQQTGTFEPKPKEKDKK